MDNDNAGGVRRAYEALADRAAEIRAQVNDLRSRAAIIAAADMRDGMPARARTLMRRLESVADKLSLMRRAMLALGQDAPEPIKD